jgi:DUF4097 and DUF4098 domain-containing protein YvlB
MVVQPADARVLVRITTVSGRVKVTAETRTGVIVDRGGVAEAGADGALEVRAPRPHDAVEVRCPEGADIVVGTRSGNIELHGQLGSVGVTSQSGSIRVAAVTDADLRTVSGVIELQSCTGRCRLSTTSGRITVGATRDAEISTTSGSIAVGGATGTVQVRSVSGSVRVASAAHGPVAARTVSGSITIQLPRGVRPRVRSSGLGKVRNRFEAGDDLVVDVANVSGTIRLVPD